MQIKKYAAALLIGGALLSNAAFAAGTLAPATVTATLNFDSPLSISPISQINFGLLQAFTAGQYTIDTTGNVTASNGGAILSGLGKSAGSFTVKGSGTQQVNISNVLGAAAGGVTLSNVTCSYNGIAVPACTGNGLAAPGTNTGMPLLVGVTATTDNTVNGTLAPTFTLNVFYN